MHILAQLGGYSFDRIALAIVVLALLASSLVACADDLKPIPDHIAVKEPAIHLPFTPVLIEPDTPIPRPEPPTPTTISTIEKGQLYVVESSVGLISLQSPEGFLNVVTAKGPMSVYGLFVDGGKRPELRTYKSENILIVTGIKPGKTELILIPVGVTEQDAIVRQVLTVSGEGPQPPPVPPGPTPPVPQPTVKHLSIAVIEDVLRITPDAAILFASRQWAALPDAGHDVMRYDKTTSEPSGLQAIQDAGSVTLPVMVIRDKDSRLILKTVPLPKDVAALDVLVKSLTGG